MRRHSSVTAALNRYWKHFSGFPSPFRASTKQITNTIPQSLIIVITSDILLQFSISSLLFCRNFSHLNLPLHLLPSLQIILLPSILPSVLSFSSCYEMCPELDWCHDTEIQTFIWANPTTLRPRQTAQCALSSLFPCKVVIIVVNFYCLSVRESGYSKRFLSPWITIPRTIRLNQWGSQTCVSISGRLSPIASPFSASHLLRPRFENTEQPDVQVRCILRFSRIWPWDCILFLFLFLVYMFISISHYIFH